jgi:hypothetical protein
LQGQKYNDGQYPGIVDAGDEMSRYMEIEANNPEQKAVIKMVTASQRVGSVLILKSTFIATCLRGNRMTRMTSGISGVF